ncbi:PadR family transcriptional regulator [Solirubrobacter phytolaccae]|uniref:PadR family transcriptional regulator n=1 Tax=Solirubrobacter phytolaccae TaxID=1404360 RepID=A0A9X3NFA7_9ACTN|nr:PadR family transcriptional regulator [Solirubrobacter phytolaccae]MDA0184996.1 PadR family transcriptional regulator [Solirubrobacter phytolaccae]
MAADAVRLMVLATAAHLEPATGYAVRKHLLDQGADRWGGVSVASIYSVLRTLTRHGHLEELDDPTGVRKATKAYRLTASGREELRAVWRRAIETVDAAHPLAFHVAITLTELVPHAEYVDALRSRLTTLDRLAELPLPDLPAARLWRALGAAERAWLREMVP